MTDSMFGQVTTIILHGVAILFLMYRIYRADSLVGKQISTKIFLTYLLLMVVNYNIYQGKMQRLVPWWLYISGHVSIHLATIIGYFILQQFLNNRMYTIGQIIRDKVFLIGMCFSGIMVFVDFLRQDLTISIWNVKEFERSWAYMTSYVLFSAVLLYGGAVVIKLFWSGLQRYNEPSFALRTWVNIIGYAVGNVVCTVAIVNIVLAFLLNHPYRMLVMQLIEDVGMPIVFLLILLGSLLPNRFYKWASRPLIIYRNWQQQQQQELLAYLHARMVQIVPRVHLENQALRHLRMDIEIGDAREMIWSHVPLARSMKPKEEAKHLWSLLQSKQVLLQLGACELPPMPFETTTYNLAVARHLKRQEQRQDKPLFPGLRNLFS